MDIENKLDVKKDYWVQIKFSINFFFLSHNNCEYEKKSHNCK